MAHEYIIVSRGYWQGNEYEIDRAGISSRKEAESILAEYEAKDSDINRQYNGSYDHKTGRQYRIITKTQAIKWYGKYRGEWNYRQFEVDGTPKRG